MHEHEHHHADDDHTHDVEQCIDACLDCYRVCLGMAMHHCLQVGGEHTEPKHFRLMLACAEMCRTAAHVMTLGFAGHAAVRALCADICDQCADDCERLDGMEDCVEACRACAHVCRTVDS